MVEEAYCTLQARTLVPLRLQELSPDRWCCPGGATLISCNYADDYCLHAK